MSPAALYFASGESLYLGAGLILVAAVMPRRWSLLRSATGWLGLILMVAACPPTTWVTYAILGGTFLLWLFTSGDARPHRIRFVGATLPLVLVVLFVVTGELIHRNVPVISGAPNSHLVIIGDSLSAGIGAGPAWPEILQQNTGFRVVNLALPGAGVFDGQAMAARVTADDRLVVIEIGGNDLLAGVPGDRFAEGLNALLSRLVAPGRTLVMFELPLIPSKIAYGQAQRRLAKKFGVFLIPKRFLTEVLAEPNATSDGLHLSPPGAQHMATLVGRVLAPVLQSRGPVPAE
jgi:acyl-CoA thioesterase I